MENIESFSKLKIKLADPEQIREWSHGEVKKPETINYRTLKPEKEGLFAEQIFGPIKDWECACGKYKRIRYKGIVCERCGVEVTKSSVRRERMGHIELACPVTHVWYFKGVPSRLAYLMDKTPKDLEKVIYFAAYLITDVNHEEIKKDFNDLKSIIAHDKNSLKNEAKALRATIEKSGSDKKDIDKAIRKIENRTKKELELLDAVWDEFNNIEVGKFIGDQQIYKKTKEIFGKYFDGSMGAEAIQKYLSNIDLEKELNELRESIKTAKGIKKIKALKRLKIVTAFVKNKLNPESMILNVLPVIPPDLRPMVQLDGGRFAASDLNDLYRKVINRNNRLKRLSGMQLPEVMMNNEKRMLQEAVDVLIDNGRRGRIVTGSNGRPLKSIADVLKGKQGRFRQNLLGKRVDYSARSVIVVGPELQLHQCGLPKIMALELFKPYVIKELLNKALASNVNIAKKMIDRLHPEVWGVLENVIKERPVLLNRAPTLHRLGIQAFEPKLIEGKTIQLHPLVCSAFNADFDGDQMAVHLPLSVEAQAESKILMLANNNILKLSDGKPVALPTLDMIIGLYHLTSSEENDAIYEFSSLDEVIMAYDIGKITLNTNIKVKEKDGKIIETTYGRSLFNSLLPDDYQVINKTLTKSDISSIVNNLTNHYSISTVAKTLDKLKDAGFYWCTRSGLTFSMSDVMISKDKTKILEKYEKNAEKIQEQFDMGMLTDGERKKETIDLWTDATKEVDEVTQKNFTKNNSLYQMVVSGASGNWMQIRQLAGIRGLVVDTKGEIIPRPIKSNYFDGMSIAEYFITTHGTRKGLTDTALRTADSGYLTRRLVDVSQDVVIRDIDCGTNRGIFMSIAEDGNLHQKVESKVVARLLAENVKDKKGTVLAKRGDITTLSLIEKLFKKGIEKVKVRSVLTCESKLGLCVNCYGLSFATSKMVEVGDSVGIIAAQSIGEPGTQLTLRTFKTGGDTTADDITQGLPRVQELFEARNPKGESPIAETSGKIKVSEDEKVKIITIIPDDKDEAEKIYRVPKRSTLLINEGDFVDAGEQLIEGTIDPKKLITISGSRATQKYIVDEIQNVYSSQGVEIHDKHIETIVKQMLKMVTIIDSGDTDLLIGDMIPKNRFDDANKKANNEGKNPAYARPELLGITKASLGTESWLSAASFQETTKVLTEASINTSTDSLVGLKENVIIGKLIPAGTGLKKE